METDYSDEGDTSGAITITIDGDKKYVRKYTLTGNITSITITSSNLTALFPTDLILIFEQTAGNAYTLPEVTALHPNDILSKTVIAAGETEEFEFVTYNSGSEWILKSQHDNAFLAYLDGLGATGLAEINEWSIATKAWWFDVTDTLTGGLAGLLKGIDDAWGGATGATWQAKLVDIISSQITMVLTDFSTQFTSWWDALEDTDTGVDGVFYDIKDKWSNVSTFIGDISQGALDWLGDQATTIIGLLGDEWTDLNALLTEIGSDAGAWLEARGTEIEAALGDTWDHLVTFGDGIITSASAWLQARGTEIEAALGTAWSNLVTFGTGITTSASAWLQARGTEIETALGTAWTTINDLATEIGTDAGAWLSARGTEIGSALGTAWTNLKTFGAGISASASDWLEARGTEIETALGTAWTNLERFAGTITTNAATWLQARGSEIETALGDTWAALSTFIDGITSSSAAKWLRDQFDTGVTSLGTALENFLFSGPKEAFAESEADGQITSALLSGGDIAAKIGTDITAAWDAFWVRSRQYGSRYNCNIGRHIG